VAVFITDGDQRSALAVVRSLGRAGIAVSVGESQIPNLASSSRYCSKRVCYPSPVEDGEGFMAFLRAQLKGGEYELLLPVTDVTMQLVASARGSFPPSVRIPFPGREQVCLAQDKRHVLDLAQRLGIPCPETYLCDDDNLEDVAQSLRYPVVVKPRFSRAFRDGQWIHGAVMYAHDPANFVATYRQAHASVPCPIVQEKLEGEGRGVFLLIWNGELKAAFCHRRLREKPPWGGVSVYCESLPLDRDLVDKSYALLKALGWEGVGMVEFKVDRRDNHPKLMEVNGRFWGSLQLAIDAGMDFPYLLYRCARGEEVPAQLEYKPGVKSRWLLGDLDHLLIKLTHAQSPNGARYSWGSRLATGASFLKFYERKTRSEVQRLDDPAPGWHEIKSYVRNSLRRWVSRGKEGRAS
jgi:predicted ATP-grasp superfamily ATP-dependent carboligase